MISSHIQITLVCDNCGLEIDEDDADSMSVDDAERRAVSDLDWEKVEDIHLCPECK